MGAIATSVDAVPFTSSPLIGDSITAASQRCITSSAGSRIASLFDEIRRNKEASKEVQEQLARIVKLSIDVKAVDCDILAASLEIAAERLLQPNPEISLAKPVINSVEERLRVLSHPWVGLRRGSSPAAKVVFGMTTFLFILLAIAEVSRRLFDVKPNPLDFHIIPLICCVGALGSFVSIMVRINEFAKLAKTDASVLFLTGFFKPWVGASFAFFVYMVLLSSGMSVVTENDPQGFCFVLTSAFLAGFSERFAQDVASRAEKAFGQIALLTDQPAQRLQ